jgi:tetratricopeptide (TPR) repeat protein
MRYLLVVAMIAVSAGPSRADDPRKAADQLAAEATRTHDEAKAVACGNAFMDLYNHDPAAPSNDEVLYNAGICFEQGHSVGAAMTSYQLLIRYYPHSKLGAKARWQSAQAFLRIARFGEAAARFEEYAKMYAGEKNARDAIENAIMLRAAIGDSAKRIEDTKYFVRTFGMKAPQAAADATLALVSAYDTPDDQIAVLRDYLRTYSGKAEREQLALGHARLADALWRRACPTTPIDGLCMKVFRDTGTASCLATELRTAIVARNATFRKDALAEYEATIKLIEEGGLKDPASIHVAAMAKIARADDDLERMMEKSFPKDLDFDPAHKAVKERSLQRFKDWVDARNKAGQALNQAYEAVLQMKDGPAAIAATARIGQIASSFSRAVVTGEIPKDVRSGSFAKDKTQAYCDKMNEVAAPLAARAAQAFTVCADKAAQLGILDDWVGICLGEGPDVDPKHFAPLEAQPYLTIAIPPATERPVKNAAPELAPALATFAKNEQTGWTESMCRQTADAFAAIAKKAKAVAGDALYMSGLSFHRCGLADDARRAYEGALKVAPDHAATLSNLGELAWRAGQRDAATKSWERALKLDGKLFAAHVDLAIALYEQREPLSNGDPQRRQLAADAELHASSALAVDANPLPLVVLALLTAEVGDKRKLELARAYLDRAVQIDDKHPAVHLGRSMLASLRFDWTLAFASAERAVVVDPRSEEALRVAGLVGVRVRRFDTAGARLATLKAQPYAVLVGRAIAARAKGNWKAAESLYVKAIQADPAGAEAHYDLGLLYELHAQPPDPQRAMEEYRRAMVNPFLDAKKRIKALGGTP